MPARLMGPLFTRTSTTAISTRDDCRRPCNTGLRPMSGCGSARFKLFRRRLNLRGAPRCFPSPTPVSVTYPWYQSRKRGENPV